MRSQQKPEATEARSHRSQAAFRCVLGRSFWQAAFCSFCVPLRSTSCCVPLRSRSCVLAFCVPLRSRQFCVLGATTLRSAAFQGCCVPPRSAFRCVLGSAFCCVLRSALAAFSCVPCILRSLCAAFSAFCENTEAAANTDLEYYIFIWAKNDLFIAYSLVDPTLVGDDHPLKWPKHPKVPGYVACRVVTVEFGLATFDHQTPTCTHLFFRARGAMRRAADGSVPAAAAVRVRRLR